MSGVQRRQLFRRDGRWADWIRNEAGDVSGWHHHADNDTYVYVLRGSVSIDFGPGGAAETFEGLARLAALRDDPASAARLYGAAEALRAAIGSARTPGEARAIAERAEGWPWIRSTHASPRCANSSTGSRWTAARTRRRHLADCIRRER